MWHFFILHDNTVLPAQPQLAFTAGQGRKWAPLLCPRDTECESTQSAYPPLPPFHCFIGLTNTSWLFKLIFASLYAVHFIYFVLFKPHPIL